ncbi:hypothetical protein [Streptomyces sp. NPDC056255]|uniref:hypothetical protein n=1 Tax=Streptomyces sp. NPDC056255 TaxID=3345764 RepID=UPI0035E061DA
MSSAGSPRFDASTAAQQMLDLEAQAEQPSLSAQQRATTAVVDEPPTQTDQLPRLLTASSPSTPPNSPNSTAGASSSAPN